MAEYIGREAALTSLSRAFADEAFDECEEETVKKCMRVLHRVPNADVAPVVRCRECEHWKPNGSKAGNSFADMEFIGGCEFTKYYRRESDFCSWGKRKEGAENA